MNTYIALLRGINVGGKNKISMPELRSALSEAGFGNVMTYINSGNVVFTSEITNITDLINNIERVIIENFSLEIPVTIVKPDFLERAVSLAPSWWDDDKDTIHYAIFVISPTSVEDVFNAMGDIKPEFEKIDSHESIIFWSAPLKTFSKSKYSKIASSNVNNNVTIRNANTVNKLLTLAKNI